MVLGINATLITLTNGTTANAPDVLTDLQNINNGGISNDGVTTTDAAGTITAVGFHATGGGALIYPITPYQLENNAPINASNTLTVTCTGVGGVPSGAKAVVLFGYFGASAVGLQLFFFPHGSTTGPQRIASATSIATDFATVIAFLDATGKLDLTAGSGGNITGLYMWMGAYIY